MSDAPPSLGPRPMPPRADDIRRRVHARLFGAGPGSATPTSHADPDDTEPECGAAGTMPDRIGRFIVLSELGRGGMGLVYKAEDPQLHRTVAIKVLRDAVAGVAMDSTGAQRLLREAQALARLTHPHVVTVHEVGTWRDHVFVAMEWVEGVTLRAWLRRKPSVHAIVDCFLQAAHGLGAAHRAGLVHRDFKPDNVMVGRDGRVRVMDFGLARGDAEFDGSRSGEIATERSDDPLQTTLTERGAIVGTPAYMAPEQHLGKPVDAASDQFAFCVACYEALAGERPFRGTRYHELAAEVVAGRRREPPRRGPRALFRVLARGLAVDPRDRYPSMEALRAALERAAKGSRWRLPAAGSAVVLASAVWWGRADTPCDDVEARLVGVWDPARREALVQRGASREPPFAAATIASTERLLTRYAESWRTHAGEVCAARALGTVDAAVAAGREACLDQRLAELQTLVDALVDGDDTVLLEATQAAAALSDLAACREAPAQGAEDLPLASELRVGLVAARVERALGRYEAAMRQVSAVLAETTDPAFVAEALLVRGDIEASLDRLDEADASLRRALELATARARHDLRAAALVRLVYVAALRSDHAGAQTMGAEARALLDVLGAAPLLRAQLEVNLGVAARRSGALEAAVEHQRRALATFVETYGPEHPATAKAHANLGTVLGQMGRHAEALEAHRMALEIFERVLGREHPDVATALGALAVDLARTGEIDEATAAWRRVVEIRRRVLPPEHPALERALHNLALVERR